ncbi:hypothetical protein [Pseudoalteromonas sp. Xi13]|uniref:hypothetical protein n=1 Tax=Pseudoalteromonas sp. Xi13 TaxID=2490635 RepID=UPI000F74EB44|nr:hypothetical protein [Pseudoalteromonas sp. Xi13]AZN32592.1 hypothetical protein EJ103_07595 [Pseudoalteromonas sp. Xi13]
MFTAAFTDPQGTEFEAAVFQVLRSGFTANKSETYAYDIREGSGDVEAETANFSLNYRIGYWPTQTSKNNGAAPYILIDTETYNADFASYSLPAEQYSGLSAEEAAELHCKTEVIGVE